MKISLYLSKMVLYDLDLINGYNYGVLALGCIYVGFKIIEQVESNFVCDKKVNNRLILDKIDIGFIKCEIM
jgi:hypothetical protein